MVPSSKLQDFRAILKSLNFPLLVDFDALANELGKNGVYFHVQFSNIAT